MTERKPFSYVIPDEAVQGDQVDLVVNVEPPEEIANYTYEWWAEKGKFKDDDNKRADAILHITDDMKSGVPYKVHVKVKDEKGKQVGEHFGVIKIKEKPISHEEIRKAIKEVKNVFEGIRDKLPAEDKPFSVKLKPTKADPTKNLVLNALIRYRSRATFKEYQAAVEAEIGDNLKTAFFRSTNAYQELVKFTDEFLQYNTPTLYDMDDLTNTDPMFACVKDDEKLKKQLSEDNIKKLVEEYFKKTPFLRAKAGELGVDNVIMERFTRPILRELIWSYWLEEGMLVQTMNAISLRFQNRSLSPGRNPLQHLDIDPLRPLGNLIWGYIDDEQHRLTVQRRAYEYDHHYGLRLYGKAVPTLQTADSRSKFLEAFHNLLYRSTIFFKEHDDMTVNADAFPLLNAIKELHLLLAEGMHNQYGDLPWTARREMFIQQHILSRPEMREFLRGGIMMPYEENWMGAVDAMKKLQGWTDVSITHFRNLAVWGEQILLSIRHDTWNDSGREAAEAANWAVDWRDAIQGYIHAYRSVTGVDLTSLTTTNKVNAILPSAHLQRRLEMQLLQR
jgi:hypothetical protein